MIQRRGNFRESRTRGISDLVRVAIGRLCILREVGLAELESSLALRNRVAEIFSRQNSVLHCWFYVLRILAFE